MNDPFMMENTISKCSYALQYRLDLLPFVKRLLHVRENARDTFGKKGSIPLVVVLEETCPETEVEFGDNSSGSLISTVSAYSLPDFLHLPSSPSRQLQVIEPENIAESAGDRVMDRVAKGHFTHL